MKRIILGVLFLLMSGTSYGSHDYDNIYITVGAVDGYWRGIYCEPIQYSVQFWPGQVAPWGWAGAECKKLYLTYDYVIPPDYTIPEEFDMTIWINEKIWYECAPAYMVDTETVLWGKNQIHLYVCLDDEKENNSR